MLKMLLKNYKNETLKEWDNFVAENRIEPIHPECFGHRGSLLKTSVEMASRIESELKSNQH